MSEEQLEPKIVLGIPGRWVDRSKIVTSIASHSGGYLFAGNVLRHLESGKSFEVDVYERDPTLAEKIRSCACGQIPEEDLEEIENHTFILYLLSDHTGRKEVEDLMDAAKALLDSGGIAVKVEFAGYSTSAENWRENAGVKAAYSLFRSFVTLVGDEREYFTCGMRVFDLPDCCVEVGDLHESFEIATEFCCYLMDESPRLMDGHTFGLIDEGRKYRLNFDDYTFYPPEDSFHNPNGLWRLTPVE